MAWTFELSDIKTDTTLVDLSEMFTAQGGAQVSARLNRPLTEQLTLHADLAALTETAPDGDPNLEVGTRSVKAYQDGVLRANCIVWSAAYDGGPNHDPKVTINCVDPVHRFGGRMLYAADGAVADFPWVSPYTGGDIMRDAISFSKIHDDEVISGVTPALFPINHLSGTWSTTTDLSSILEDTPITLGDLYALLVETGAVDFILAPADSSFPGTAAGQLGVMSAYDQAGSDISATVHFDYATGLKNVQSARRLRDMSTVANKIRFLLGPKMSSDHWAASIEGTNAGLEDWLALELASREKYGAYVDYRIYDGLEDDAAGRPLYTQLFKTDVMLRAEARDLVYFTPTANTFRPFIDYSLGDIVGVNASSYLGTPISGAKQRVYGFDVSIEDGVERVGELVCSADAEGGP